MAQRYTEDLKMAIVRSHIEDGRTLTSLSKKYNNKQSCNFQMGKSIPQRMPRK